MKRIIYSILAASTVLFTSCDKEEPATEEQSFSGQYILGFKSLSDGEPEFLVGTDDLMNDTINAENGIEQIGWRYFHEANGTLFSSGYQEENVCNTFERINEEEIGKLSDFVFDNALNIFATTEDESKVLAMEIIDNGDSKNKLYTIDASSGNITAIKSLSNYYDSTTQTIGYPTGLVTRDDKLFIPFIKYDALGTYSNPITDTAVVAVYSYPELEFEKFIHDARTGYIGTHGANTGLIRTGSGDLYSFSSTSTVAGLTAAEKPSGILKINAGETDFDNEYFFDVEAATGGDKIFRMHSLGNGKAFARLITDETQGTWGTWTAYSRDTEAFTQKGVIIDLENKTITEIEDLPLSAMRWSAPVFIEGNNLYLSIETESDAYIYKVDINTATATKGAFIDGKTVKGIFKL